MATNSPRNKHFKSAKGNLWAKFDAQPLHAKEWFCNFPIDLWPPDFQPINDWQKAEAEKSYLAGLKAIWGPDHPAVQAASLRVTTRRGKPVELFTPDDLDGLF